MGLMRSLSLAAIGATTADAFAPKLRIGAARRSPEPVLVSTVQTEAVPFVAGLGLGLAAAAAGAGTGLGLASLVNLAVRRRRQQPRPAAARQLWSKPLEQAVAAEPLGHFDPLGVCEPGDGQPARQLRSAELKLGRVAMLALSSLAQRQRHAPGLEGALPDSLVGPAASGGRLRLTALLATAGVAEGSAWRGEDEDLGLAKSVPELEGGDLGEDRAAMLAAVGIVAAELLTGEDGLRALSRP